MSSRIHIKIDPMGKPRMTQRDVWKQRPVVVRYRSYADELRRQLPGYRLPAELEIIFAIAMPTSWSKKRKAEMVGEPHQQKPDIDNLLKGFMDNLSDQKLNPLDKNAADDSHVWNVRAAKVWDTEGSITLIQK